MYYFKIKNLKVIHIIKMQDSQIFKYSMKPIIGLLMAQQIANIFYELGYIPLKF